MRRAVLLALAVALSWSAPAAAQDCLSADPPAPAGVQLLRMGIFPLAAGGACEPVGPGVRGCATGSSAGRGGGSYG